MNRNGDVLRVELVDSLGNKPLDDSCIDAIKLSRNFGKVPDDIKGELILIPFIFGYYSR
jgi:outer membrane biosynthesis protein TonB